MSELKPCPFCGYEPETRKVIVYPNGEKSLAFIKCRRCNYWLFGYNYEALVVHWNCRPIENTLRDELIDTDMLLKEATEAIGAVVACCTYNSNDDAKIGIYGIDQKSIHKNRPIHHSLQRCCFCWQSQRGCKTRIDRRRN